MPRRLLQITRDLGERLRFNMLQGKPWFDIQEAQILLPITKYQRELASTFLVQFCGRSFRRENFRQCACRYEREEQNGKSTGVMGRGEAVRNDFAEN
ncbi:hypothetical protein E2542_SST02184 [Spatholobus suberectus]|nr:hypothetical protein E2542_SST02184 [Spatholobus suberectus]